MSDVYSADEELLWAMVRAYWDIKTDTDLVDRFGYGLELQVEAMRKAVKELELRHAGPSDGDKRGDFWKRCYESTKPDAERYRWLRVRPSFIGWDWWDPPVPKEAVISPDFMDAAIDEKLRLGCHNAATN